MTHNGNTLINMVHLLVAVACQALTLWQVHTLALLGSTANASIQDGTVLYSELAAGQCLQLVRDRWTLTLVGGPAAPCFRTHYHARSSRQCWPTAVLLLAACRWAQDLAGVDVVYSLPSSFTIADRKEQVLAALSAYRSQLRLEAFVERLTAAKQGRLALK